MKIKKFKDNENNEKKDEEDEERVRKMRQREDQKALKSIPAEELNLIDWFLDRFCFVANGSTSRETVDLKMTLKSLPNRMDMSNIERID